MSRYEHSPSDESEAQPGSHGRVLRNLLGITRKTDLDLAEYQALVAAQKRSLLSISQDTRFDAGLICRMHRDWLGGIYSWAGQYRSVDVAKDGFSWPRAFTVPDNMARFSDTILATHTPCRPGVIEEVCRSIAIVHAELLLIHPFREGNGRLARWLADLMAAQANYRLPVYRFDGRGSRATRAQYLTAVQQGYIQRYDLLVAFFADAIRQADVVEATGW